MADDAASELVEYQEDAPEEGKEDAQADEAKKGHYAGIHASGFSEFLLKPELTR